MAVRARSAPAARRSSRTIRTDDIQLRMRLRIYRGDEIAFGPGKAELLEAIASTGSIAQAAKRLDMSYMRAWTLIRTMNGCFAAPLVEAVRGGTRGGEARLTQTGRDVLGLYREITTAGMRSVLPSWRKLRRHLRT